MEVTATLKKQISDILVDNSDPENRIKFYDDWCDKYDEDLVVVGNYTGHTKCVEAFLQLELNRNIAVLDLACGTGLLGAEVATMISTKFMIFFNIWSSVKARLDDSSNPCYHVRLGNTATSWWTVWTLAWGCWARPGSRTSTETTSSPWWRSSDPSPSMTRPTTWS